MSIRLKLSLLYLSFIMLTMVIFGVGLHLLMIAHLETEIDETLRSQARSVLRVAQVGGRLSGIRPEVGVLVEPPGDDLRGRQVYLQVLDPEGRPVIASVNLQGHSLPVTAGALRVIETRQERMESVDLEGGFRLRLLTQPIMRGGELAGVVQSAQSLELADSTTQRFRDLLLGGGVSMTVVGLLSGLYLTRKALSPVAQITRTAEAITRRGDLSRRITAGRGGDELGTLGRTFNRMLDHIEDGVESQRRFIGDASHELKTPLTVIRGNAELLSRDPDGVDAAAQAITRETDRMQRIVDDLLAVAELDAPGAMPLAPVDAHALAARVLADFAPVAASRTLALAGADALWVQANADKLERAIRNLVHNAIRATSAAGRVDIRLMERGGMGSITVSDDGDGIPEEHMAHVFERFYRVDPGRSRASGGTGLGLTIARGVAEAHGGSIHVRRAQRGGAEFEIRLPIDQEPNGEPLPA